MNISFEKLPNLKTVIRFGPETQPVTSAVYNSADVTKGAVFCCVVGENTDGHLYIEEAIQRGAAAVIGSDQSVLKRYAARYPGVTFAAMEDPREALSAIAILLSENAQDQLLKVGVTGTNGKTTVASYVRNLLNLTGVPCGFLGTTGIWLSDRKLPFKKSTPTTPLSSDIHQIFDQLVKAGDKAASMEVTSIAIDQKRVAGIEFDVVIHTNISEEHMEYHKTFEHYLAAKLKLFQQTKRAVVNLDDKGMAKEILETAVCPVLTYSEDIHSGADLVWTNCRSGADGLSFDLIWRGVTYPVTLPIYGEYNAGNLTAAIGALLMVNMPLERILKVLPGMDQVEGRFQVIRGPEERKIIIDYAHTPVALDLVLREVKKLPHNRLIALIAGVGIRDFGKMPKMAKAAEGKADLLVVTVDHPGDHDPAVVIDEVLKGFSKPFKQRVVTALTRREAVTEALRLSGPGDIVLLTSGCINGAQIIKGQAIPHSDEAIIEEFFLPQS